MSNFFLLINFLDLKKKKNQKSFINKYFFFKKIEEHFEEEILSPSMSNQDFSDSQASPTNQKEYTETMILGSIPPKEEVKSQLKIQTSNHSVYSTPATLSNGGNWEIHHTPSPKSEIPEDSPLRRAASSTYHPRTSQSKELQEQGILRLQLLEQERIKNEAYEQEVLVRRNSKKQEVVDQPPKQRLPPSEKPKEEFKPEPEPEPVQEEQPKQEPEVQLRQGLTKKK